MQYSKHSTQSYLYKLSRARNSPYKDLSQQDQDVYQRGQEKALQSYSKVLEELSPTLLGKVLRSVASDYNHEGEVKERVRENIGRKKLTAPITNMELAADVIENVWHKAAGQSQEERMNTYIDLERAFSEARQRWSDPMLFYLLGFIDIEDFRQIHQERGWDVEAGEARLFRELEEMREFFKGRLPDYQIMPRDNKS